MNFRRPVLATVSLLLGLALALVGLAAPTTAAPPIRPGPVANLTLTVAAATGGGYQVTANWTPLSTATAYKVDLTSQSGASLAAVTVTAPPWSAQVALAPNSQIKVTVTPLAGKKPGNAASAVALIPDLAPPVGTYTVTRSGMDATITQTSLSDDATPAPQITRVVSWGDGSPAQTWQTGDTLTHNFAALGRYVPTITLTDQAGNAVTLTLRAAVFGDTSAPVGNFASGPPAAFASWSTVTLTQESLTDNYTPTDLVERTVSWGDGSTEAWPTGATLTHVYTIAGSYIPSVVMLDEADNSSKIFADPVQVTVDSTGPVVRVAKPKGAAKVRSWRTVRGTAKDAGVGTASVAVLAIQKRGATWFAYNALTKKWAGVGTKTRAWKRAKAIAGSLDRSAWKVRVTGLRKGRLELRASALDNVGNASRRVSTSARLTK